MSNSKELEGPIGKIHEPKTMFFRSYVGEAANENLAYEMNNKMDGSPLIQSKQTGKWFSLSWQDILNLADQAGIDKEGD